MLTNIYSKNVDEAINKAYLRDLTAMTGLEILLKLDSNHQFFGPYNLEI